MMKLGSLKPYFWRYRWRFATGIAFVFLANYFGTRVPLIVGETINSLKGGLDPTLLGWMSGYIVVIAALGGCFRYLMRRVLIDTSRDMEYDFRNDLYRHLQRLDRTYYDGTSTGDVMSRMTNDIEAVRMMIGPAVMYTANTIFTVPLVVVAMVALDWRVTLAALAPMLLIPVVTKFFGASMHRRFKEQQEAMSELTTFAQETFSGIRVVKAYVQEDANLARFGVENDRFIDKSMKLVALQAFFFPLIRLAGGFGLVAIVGIGAMEILAGRLDFGSLVALVMLYTALMWPLIAAGWVINLFQRSAAAMERLDDIFRTPARVADAPSMVAADTLPAALDIEFRHLTFAYESTQRPALRDITLKVPAGHTIGIVGRVGSGKSTLVNLLLRLYPVERGTLFVGGIDINDWPLEELRRRVGIVFQEAFLFSETIRENIEFGALEGLDEQEMFEAAVRADVDKDIRAFPKTYDTMLGERGINLSGGQKQRVTMARAFVRDASVLVLDDSLSAVDTHTEDTILRSLRAVMAGRTTFLISHRLSTVALADEIIVLDDGAIIQRGGHDVLIAQEGLYAELWRRQQLEAEVEGVA